MQRSARAADQTSMLTTTHVPALGHVAYLTEDLYRQEDAQHGHLYQRHVVLLRLADVLEDQLALDEDDALVLAAELLSVGEHEA